MPGWKRPVPKKLKKIAYGLTKDIVGRVIADHEKRGWKVASEIKQHGYGFGCLMTLDWENNKHDTSKNTH